MVNYQDFESIPEWVRLDVAIEIMAEKLAEKRREIRSCKENNDETQQGKLEKELELLLEERQNMYFGDNQIIKKIIVIYGPQVRKNLEDDNKK